MTALARELYDYLPGSSRGRGTYTFATAAGHHGVGEFWIGGSKLPALTQLLELTLERRSSAFCPLVETIVREGLKYRHRQGTPMTQQDLNTLNALIKAVGFKIPSLWDPAFAGSLPDAPVAAAPSPATTASPTTSPAFEQEKRRREAITALKSGSWSSTVCWTVRSRVAGTAITQGKQPNFLMLDGYHLFAVLDNQEDLPALLRALLRELADTGRPHVTLPELAVRR